jgi:hypothetical protein
MKRYLRRVACISANRCANQDGYKKEFGFSYGRGIAKYISLLVLEV